MLVKRHILAAILVLPLSSGLNAAFCQTCLQDQPVIAAAGTQKNSPELNIDSDLGMAVLGQLKSSADHAKTLAAIRAIPAASLRCHVMDYSQFPEDMDGVDPVEFQRCNPFHKPPVKLVTFSQETLSKDRRRRILDPRKASRVFVLIVADPLKIVATMKHTGSYNHDRTYFGSPPYQNNVSAEFGLTLNQPTGPDIRYKIQPTGFKRIQQQEQ